MYHSQSPERRWDASRGGRSDLVEWKPDVEPRPYAPQGKGQGGSNLMQRSLAEGEPRGWVENRGDGESPNGLIAVAKTECGPVDG